MRKGQTVVKVIILGPPGSGKGTQSVRLANMLGVPRVSSGDLFRDHQDRDTDLGQLARSYMEQGVLVPDEVTIKMMLSWIEDTPNGAGFLLDDAFCFRLSGAAAEESCVALLALTMPSRLRSASASAFDILLQH